MSDDKEVCKVCGKEFDEVNASHLRTHNMDMEEYDNYEEIEVDNIEVNEPEIVKIKLFDEDVSYFVEVEYNTGKKEECRLPLVDRRGIIKELKKATGLGEEEIEEIMEFNR